MLLLRYAADQVNFTRTAPMDRITPTLAERIAARRKELGLRQEDLAQAAGVSTAAVSQWERGETKNLKLENFFAIADKLKVQARWLALGQGAKFAAVWVALVIPALLPLLAGPNCILCQIALRRILRSIYSFRIPSVPLLKTGVIHFSNYGNP